MKKALILEGQIVQIEAVSFPVAPELIWIDVADDVGIETHMLAGNVAVVKPMLPPPSYQQLRKAAYPPIGDQLDAMWKGGEAEAAMAQTIISVKVKFPKT